MEKELKIKLKRVTKMEDEPRPSRKPTETVSKDEQAKMMIDFVNGDDSRLPLKVVDVAGKGRGVVTTRLLRSAAQRALRSERRSQKWERERERRSLKKMGARARAALSKKAER